MGIGTVSRVINGSPQVREETRKKVLAAIRELDYSPNPIARQLSAGKSWVVGVISPFFTNPSFVQRLIGIQNALDSSPYNMMLYSMRSPEQLKGHVSDFLRRTRVDGLVVLVIHALEEELINFDPSLPVVMVVEEVIENYPHIMIDNIQGGYQATQHLIERGHRQIGFIGDELENPLKLRATPRRYEGFQNALRDANLPHRQEWCLFGTHSEQSARELALQLFEQKNRPTAIVASSDTLAFGVMEAVSQKNLRIPEDVAIIGFDDIPSACTRQLTTIRQPLIESGHQGMKLLLEWLDNGAIEENQWQTVLPLDIVVRGTT